MSCIHVSKTQGVAVGVLAAEARQGGEGSVSRTKHIQTDTNDRGFGND